MFGRRTREGSTLFFDETGFEAEVRYSDGETERARATWADVTSATAFKRDLFVYDKICIRFQTSDGRSVEVDEEMEGWTAFVEELQRFLPGCTPFAAWARQVALPAFAPNELLLYSSR